MKMSSWNIVPNPAQFPSELPNNRFFGFSGSAAMGASATSYPPQVTWVGGRRHGAGETRQYVRSGNRLLPASGSAQKDNYSNENSDANAQGEEKSMQHGGRERLESPRPRQQASCSRVSFSPFRLPSTVTAIDSVWKNSLASCCSSSAVTLSIFSSSSSMV